MWLLWLILYMLVALGVARLLHWLLLRTGADSSMWYRVVRVLCLLYTLAYPALLAFPIYDDVLVGTSAVMAFTSLVCIEYTAWGKRMPWLLSMLLTVLLLCGHLVAIFFSVVFMLPWRT